MKSNNRMDCRPIQFRSNKYPKNSGMCRWYCPYWLVCRGEADKPKPKVLHKELKRVWELNKKNK